MNSPTGQRRVRLHLKISLESLQPEIWRRVEVDDQMTFWDFHRVIQSAMVWDNAHLHEFRVADRRVGASGLDDELFGDQPVLPEDSTRLGDLLGAKRKFRYWYDFGDDWWHTIAIEKRLPPDPTLPAAVLLAGERACPPEDCGGVWGYADLLQDLADPASEGYEYAIDRVGETFDPETFNFAAHAARVAAIGN